MFILCSSAYSFARGEARSFAPGARGAGTSAAGMTSDCGFGASVCAGTAGSAELSLSARSAEISSPGLPTMAMGSVTGTVSPSGCRIFSTVPVAVASMVMVSLSVSISKRG
ncbi:hypothetical protein [Ruminococcus gauvreauii]|uniref:Uncharacterized protein n=1 Tax=Ruminococcus gauvreauii TaxID=438033 RepID=A0ABY5VDB0_9FIRM|nr:hypothetical protein [Ruminococcus gauvreauii]UWP58324.1 hypothetical protein NQ502_13150 [Ruminococcus gauvreauii]